MSVQIQAQHESKNTLVAVRDDLSWDMDGANATVIVSLDLLIALDIGQDSSGREMNVRIVVIDGERSGSFYASLWDATGLSPLPYPVQHLPKSTERNISIWII